MPNGIDEIKSSLHIPPIAGQNDITRLRSAFKIPDSVLIVSAAALNKGVFPKSHIGKQPDDKKLSIPQGAAQDQSKRTGILNTKIFSNIEFLSKTYTDAKGRSVKTPHKIYDAVLITVSQAKKIIKTEIQGADGTVKEYIGMDDYQIQLNGIITGSNGVHPRDEIADLKTILDAPVVIDVACDYLRNLGIDSVVISEYDLGQDEGGMSYQTFSLKMLSDIPIQLRLSGI